MYICIFFYFILHIIFDIKIVHLYEIFPAINALQKLFKEKTYLSSLIITYNTLFAR